MTAPRSTRTAALLVASVLCTHLARPPAAGAAETWDVEGSATATARYEGRTFRAEYPFRLFVTLEDDGTYRMSMFDASCREGALPDVVGRWRGGVDQVTRTLVRDGVRAAARACYGPGSSVHGVVARVELSADGMQMSGRFRLRLRLRVQDGRDVEHIRARVSGRLSGTLVSGQAASGLGAL